VAGLRQTLAALPVPQIVDEGGALARAEASAAAAEPLPPIQRESWWSPDVVVEPYRVPGGEVVARISPVLGASPLNKFAVAQRDHYGVVVVYQEKADATAGFYYGVQVMVISADAMRAGKPNPGPGRSEAHEVGHMNEHHRMGMPGQAEGTFQGFAELVDMPDNYVLSGKTSRRFGNTLGPSFFVNYGRRYSWDEVLRYAGDLDQAIAAYRRAPEDTGLRLTERQSARWRVVSLEAMLT
jgi:hypothetical protein